MARQFTWVPPTGAPIVLTDRSAGYRVLAGGTRGWDAPSYRTSVDTYAGQAGGRLQAIQPDVRDLALGMSIEAATESEFRARKRALVRAFRPMAGDGRLQVADEAGQVRTIICRYESGLEGDAENAFDGKSWRAVVRFTAYDPWFYGESVPVSFGLAAPTSFFPFFPLVLSPSSIQGQFTADLSDTDAPTYPVWTITGPGSTLTLTNVTTGRIIQVNATLGDGQKMVIDTRPGRQSVRSGDGANLMGSLASDPALWPLIEGVNVISALLTNANANSRISGIYTPKYSGI